MPWKIMHKGLDWNVYKMQYIMFNDTYSNKDVILSQNDQRYCSIADIFQAQAGVIRLNSFPHKMRKQRMLQISWGYHLIL